MNPISPKPPTPESRAASDEARLKKSAQQMEGLFVQQLYKAMRETVPSGEGVVDGGSGDEMFTGLMDEHLAADTPTQWAHGLAAAAYRQLRAALPHAGESTGAPDVPGTTSATPAMPLSSSPQSLPLAAPPPLKLDSSR